MLQLTFPCVQIRLILLNISLYKTSRKKNSTNRKTNKPAKTSKKIKPTKSEFEKIQICLFTEYAQNFHIL